MADALSRQADWLYTRLHGDSTLLALLATDAGHTGVYVDEVAPPPRWPAVIVANLSMQDLTCLGPGRAGVNAVWLVKAVVNTRQYADAQPIMDRVDALLQSPYGQGYSGAVQVITGEASIALAETDSGGRWFRHLGRRYRVLGPAF